MTFENKQSILAENLKQFNKSTVAPSATNKFLIKPGKGEVIFSPFAGAAALGGDAVGAYPAQAGHLFLKDAVALLDVFQGPAAAGV